MPSENLTGRTIAGYRLLERVGEGGTAEVYRAEHPARGPCAFKVLRPRLKSDPNAVTRFLREAGYGARVQHPGVVRMYDYGEADGQHYLALEWAAGTSLAEMVPRAGRLDPTLVGSLVHQLGEGLGAAHRVGIIHRDLKPENIMYDEATETVKEAADEDEEVVPLDLARDDRSEAIDTKVVPMQETEFMCRNCFLVKHRSQLADKKRMYCRDCA